MKRKLNNRELKVIRIQKRAIEELLIEFFMEKGSSIFNFSNPCSATYHMRWDDKTGDFICTVNNNKKRIKLDYDKLLEEIPATTDTIFKKKPYKVVRLSNFVKK